MVPVSWFPLAEMQGMAAFPSQPSALLSSLWLCWEFSLPSASLFWVLIWMFPVHSLEETPLGLLILKDLDKVRLVAG